MVGSIWGDASADKAALDWYGKNDAKKDPGSLYTITNAIGARDVWHKKDAAGRAVTGRGVTVAVLDSGVSAVPGLDAPGKVVQGPDLSLEANSDTTADTDTFGHGTHMAGIIAAKDTVEVDAKTGEPKADDDPAARRRPRRPAAGPEAGHHRRQHRRQPGDRRPGLGGAAPERQRYERPGGEPVVRDASPAAVPAGPAGGRRGERVAPGTRRGRLRRQRRRRTPRA